ncbi:MAG: methylamine utilization protein MauJ, partial [Anaerolineae bacterium]
AISSTSPLDELYREALRPYHGKTFNVVRDQLKKPIRHAIAHLNRINAVLDADYYNDITVCSRAIPVLKYMARQMLDNEVKSLSVL